MKFRYDWSDDEHEYHFSICETADHASGKSDGFVQINKKNQKTVVIGRLDDVDLESVGKINVHFFFYLLNSNLILCFFFFFSNHREHNSHVVQRWRQLPERMQPKQTQCCHLFRMRSETSKRS